ncbi:hypothetical protein OUY22_15560 [Nonomuraea sp. MCN248]|uniref:Uncharacterized protein n=2 Tax=Nonomuraea TaxID=83681 RepID=A0ABT4SCH3_9ACTN|nr:hypothetical protein [Nonomuraea corallina]MDA0634840.1 hypothetical protein [Nonomuraea corallina]
MIFDGGRRAAEGKNLTDEAPVRYDSNVGSSVRTVMEWGDAMGELSAAIDHLATEDVTEIPTMQLAEQVLELHWQMARLQAQIARRTGVRLPG